MDKIRYTLLGDGSSDRILMPILDWLFTQHRPELPIIKNFADFRFLPNPPPVKSLELRVQTAIELFPCDILFIHRDAEKASYEARANEIDKSLIKFHNTDNVSTVKVIPIRMSETWLLIDIAAIRIASGNRKTNIPLTLPNQENLESLSNSKGKLIELIRSASGLKGRKLQRLSERSSIHLVAENITDFSPLRRLSAFKKLERDFISTLRKMDI